MFLTLCGRRRDRAVERWCRPEPCHPDISDTHQSPGIKHHLQTDKHHSISYTTKQMNRNKPVQHQICFLSVRAQDFRNRPMIQCDSGGFLTIIIESVFGETHGQMNFHFIRADKLGAEGTVESNWNKPNTQNSFLTIVMCVWFSLHYIGQLKDNKTYLFTSSQWTAIIRLPVHKKPFWKC